MPFSIECGFELTNQRSNVVESFKTPGKLRGKTPRTVRQNNGHDNRAVSYTVTACGIV